MSDALRGVLRDAAILTGDRDAELSVDRAPRSTLTAKNQHAMDHVLRQRLNHAAHAPSWSATAAATATDANAQRRTGWCALVAARAVHTAMPADPKTPALGMRDLAMLQRLVAVCFAWLVVPVVDAYDAAYAQLYAPTDSARISDVDEDERAWFAARDALDKVATTLVALLPRGAPSAHMDVATLVGRVHLADVFRVLVRAAYGPGGATASAERDLLAALEAQPALAALGALRSVSTRPALGAQSGSALPVPAFVRAHAGRLLSAQLLRPEGVRAFYIAMLGADERDMLSGDVDVLTEGDSTFQRLDGVARLLTTPPRDLPRTAYYAGIVPRILDVLDPGAPDATSATPVHGMHRRAAAFTLVRLFERDAEATWAALETPIWAALASHEPVDAQRVDVALRLVAAAVTLAPPAPDWLVFLVGPLLPRLLSLDTALQAPRASIAQRGEVAEILHTYLRLGPSPALAPALTEALRAALSDAMAWDTALHGTSLVPADPALVRVEALLHDTLSLEQLASQDEHDALALPARLAQTLRFGVDPARFASLLHTAHREDLGQALLLSSLDEYRRTQAQVASGVHIAAVADDALERRAVFHLHTVYQLLHAFGSALVDGDVDRVLQFIDFACAIDVHEGEPTSPLAALRNVQAAAATPDTELVTTALQLLLSLLERHTDITPTSSPLLRVLAAKVERLRDASDAEVRALSQEAVVALAARARQTEAPAPPTRARYLDVYQEALRYLQDPILPVRAHGLHLLAQLVSTDPRDGPSYGAELDPALLPAIFDLFVQAIQDDESFLYLNAVQGLAQMAACWRGRVLPPLMNLYVGGDTTHAGLERALSGGALTQRETDKRLRLGEAVLQVLQYSGEALAPELTRVIEPLLTAVRAMHFPATLRSSFIAILGTCVEIAPVAVASSAARQLVALCAELVTLTSVARTPRRRPRVQAHVAGIDVHGHSVHAAVDSDSDSEMPNAAIDANTRLPQLRRAALLLLALLVRTTRHQVEDYADEKSAAADAPLTALRLPGGGRLPDTDGARRAAPPPPLLVTPTDLPSLYPLLQHVSTEDLDALVRQQARDCIDEAHLLESAWAAAALV